MTRDQHRISALVPQTSFRGETFGASTKIGSSSKSTATKTSLESELVLLQVLSRSFHLVQFVKCWKIFLVLNS